MFDSHTLMCIEGEFTTQWLSECDIFMFETHEFEITSLKGSL